MDTVALVEYQIDEGQKLLDRLVEKGVPVRAACWLKPVDEDRWSLYLATPILDQLGELAAYGEVLPVLRSLGDVWISSSDLMLVGEKNPLVQDAHAILRRFPHNKPIRSPRSLVGGRAVEEVYVYSLGKTQVPIYQLWFPGAPDEIGSLSLDLHLLEGRFSVRNENGKEYKSQTGIACVVLAPEGAKLERDASGEMILSWDLHGTRTESSADEVWSLAKLGLHGFRFLHEAS